MAIYLLINCQAIAFNCSEAASRVALGNEVCQSRLLAVH